eukprot:1101863-Pleurochrysis_carterae.AAC.1
MQNLRKATNLPPRPSAPCGSGLCPLHRSLSSPQPLSMLRWPKARSTACSRCLGERVPERQCAPRSVR